MGAVSLELRLLGGFRMVDAANGAPIPLRRYDRMFAFLALHAPDMVPRPEVCRILWPGVATGAASSRLRVALTSFGNQWSGLLVRDGRSLGLDPSLIRTDVWSVRAEAKKLSATLDEEAELDGWMALLPQLRLPLLPDWHDEWLEEARREWNAFARDQLLGAAELAVERGETERAVQFAEGALQRDPYSEAGWRLYVAQSSRCGAGRKATGEFQAARRQLRSELGLDFSEALIADLELSGIDGFAPATDIHAPHTIAEAEIMTRAFLSALESQPLVAGGLMAIPEFCFEASAAPKRFLALLERAVRVIPQDDPIWAGCFVNWLSVRFQLGERSELLEDVGQLLAATRDPFIQARSLGLKATSLMYVGDTAGAEKAARQSLDLCRDFNLTTHWPKALHDMGLVEMLRGRHAEAEANMLEGLAMVEPVTTRTAGISRAYLRYALAKNSFVQGEFEAANEWMRTALDTGHEYAHDGSYTQYLPLAGLVYFSAGHDREGIRLLADSLRQLHRSGHVRGQQSSLSYAARILWSRGHLETAAHIAGYELAWRERTDRPRTLFHQMVMRGIPARTESQMESAWSSKRPPVQVLRAVYQHLQDLLPGMTGARARMNDVRRPVI